jgi:SH3-like domain-containing protein
MKFYFLFLIGMIYSVSAYSAPANYLCVSVKKAYLRQTPNQNSKVSWIVGKHMPLEGVGRVRDWYKVKDMDSQVHWVHMNSVTSQGLCVAVTKSGTKLHAGPGSKYKLADFSIADRYYPYRTLDHDENWILVQDDRGNKGWVNSNLLWSPQRVVSLGY